MRNHRRMSPTLASVVLALYIPVTATAATITGQVQDAATQDPIGNVKVAVVNSTDHELAVTQTDSGGKYTLDNLPPGVPVGIKFSRLGYLRNPERKSATTSNHSLTVDCLLLRQSAQEDYYQLFAGRLRKATHIPGEGDAVELRGLYEALPAEDKAYVKKAL